MQTIQTALDYLALLPIATAILMFVGYCWERSTPAVEPTRTAEFLELVEQKFAEADMEIATESDWEIAWSSAALAMEPDPTTVVEVENSAAIAVHPPTDPNTLNSHELRKLCKDLGIRWRNAHGKGKHLSRPEMLQAIGTAIA